MNIAYVLIRDRRHSLIFDITQNKETTKHFSVLSARFCALWSNDKVIFME